MLVSFAMYSVTSKYSVCNQSSGCMKSEKKRALCLKFEFYIRPRRKVVAKYDTRKHQHQ